MKRKPETNIYQQACIKREKARRYRAFLKERNTWIALCEQILTVYLPSDLLQEHQFETEMIKAKAILQDVTMYVVGETPLVIRALDTVMHYAGLAHVIPLIIPHE